MGWRRNLRPPLGLCSQRRNAATANQRLSGGGSLGLKGDTLRIGCSSGFWGDSATAG